MIDGFPFAGILFDVDGVLVDSEAFMAEAACRMFKELHGLDVAPAEFDELRGRKEHDYYAAIAKKYGREAVQPRDRNRAYELYIEAIAGRLKPMKGVIEFIGAMRERGVRMATATNAGRMKLEGSLREIGLPPESFDACLTVEDITHSKPHPEIFLLAAERIGVPPEDALVVEDSPHGVQAARRAGCRCLGITSSYAAATLSEAGANWTADDLEEAARIEFTD